MKARKNVVEGVEVWVAGREFRSTLTYSRIGRSAEQICCANSLLLNFTSKFRMQLSAQLTRMEGHTSKHKKYPASSISWDCFIHPSGLKFLNSCPHHFSSCINKIHLSSSLNWASGTFSTRARALCFQSRPGFALTCFSFHDFLCLQNRDLL